jgi:hypothetical protein
MRRQAGEPYLDAPSAEEAERMEKALHKREFNLVRQKFGLDPDLILKLLKAEKTMDWLKAKRNSDIQTYVPYKKDYCTIKKKWKPYRFNVKAKQYRDYEHYDGLAWSKSGPEDLSRKLREVVEGLSWIAEVVDIELIEEDVSKYEKRALREEYE